MGLLLGAALGFLIIDDGSTTIQLQQQEIIRSESTQRSLENQIQELESSLTKKESDLSNSELELSTSKDNLLSSQSKISELESNISNLNNDKSDLETQLNSLIRQGLKETVERMNQKIISVDGSLPVFVSTSGNK